MSDTKNKVKRDFQRIFKGKLQTECGKFKNIYLWS